MSDNEEDEVRVVRRTSSPQTTTSELAAGLSRWMEASHSFFYVELGSLVLLFACIADWFNSVWYKYAVSVAAISLIICLILQTAEFILPGFLEWVLIEKRNDGGGGHSIQKVVSVFLLLWWIMGTGIITFKGPFVATSNGWFGAWGSLLATVKWSIGLKRSFYDEKPEGLKMLYIIITCSVILLFACEYRMFGMCTHLHYYMFNLIFVTPLTNQLAIPPLTQKWRHYGGAGFAIAGAAITLIACAYLITMYSDTPKSVMKLTVLLLFMLWACIAGVTTFYGPFQETTNNGFFAAWGGCLASMHLMVLEMKDSSPENA